jgi:gliding motility-associated-like protein
MKTYFLAILSFPFIFVSQNIGPSVLNSAGTLQNFGSGNTLSSNIGEVFTEQLSSGNSIITQGFLQPDITSTSSYTLNPFVIQISCTGKNDGMISTSISYIQTNVQTQYFWQPSTVCPNNDCLSIDSLTPGTYSLTVIVNYTSAIGQPIADTSAVREFTITDVNGPCKLIIYNGVTYNGDGINDKWIIDNIEDFPNNKINIYNRWGQEIFYTEKYNNSNNFWPRNDDANRLAPGTYFYVVNAGDGSPLYKGWLELIKN